MAKARLTAKEKKQLLDLMKRAHLEMNDSMDKFVQEDVLQNSPDLSDYLKEMMEQDEMPAQHTRFGVNPHVLSCGRCQRATRLSIPMFKDNAQWRCPDCNHTMYSTEEDFHNCPKCKTAMDHVHTMDKDDEVHFDFLCGACRRHKDEHTKIAKEGGAIVRCTVCHTLGAVPKTDKAVKDFRAKYEVPKDVVLGFTLDETQCPRCADVAMLREFKTEELKGLLIVQEDINEVAQHFQEKGAKNKAAVAKKPTTKKGKRDATIDAMAKKATDDFLEEVKTTDGPFVRHPGSKTFN